MKPKLLVILIFTLIMLYIGLWSELVGRIKFNQWDIIGPKGRVTNHNLYSNLYMIGILIFFLIYISVKIKRYLKLNKNE